MPNYSPAQRPSRAELEQQRAHGAQLAWTDNVGQLAERQIDATADVVDQAIVRAMMNAHTREMAEQWAPSGAHIYAMLANTGAMEMAGAIRGLHQP